ncbi:hypothetical protein LTR36_008750 [Oleoguttula mirabilis]|uniref:Uncharacterized protein n=1 Tax=Oleoguttula mirabilis TaxID=1507867 RepID=A0AAV9JVG3_9PEZI|nr:hypothetical protein LTR36_008750 [Oleoguttula mirabilis]
MSNGTSDGPRTASQTDEYFNGASSAASPAGKRHIAVAAQEFQDLKELEKFYADPRRAHSAALRVIHVQNATWATHFLLNRFNIDHPSEVVGMQGFSKWARFEKPRQRNGRPFPNGRAFREQTDPWRNISRTAFGLDYLKPYPTAPPNRRHQRRVFGDKPVDAKMMHLDVHEDSRNPYGYDVSVQRLSVYVQRTLGPPGRVSPDIEVRNPYSKQLANGHRVSKNREEIVDLEKLDNTNTVIVFETSASMLLEDCLVQPRNDFEKRWRRLSFYLKKEEALNDARLSAQCTNMILGDVFHGLAIVWESFLKVAQEHINILEDKIYENPADESRAPELWTNQAAWLKVDKIMWIHQDLVKQMQGQMKALAEVEPDDEDEAPIPPPDWLSSTPAEYDKLGHSVQEDLVQPTANLSDLMYKSVGIRDSRQSLQLGLSMWRLSWITFIFLPLTFVVSFFGMNVSVFGDPSPSIGWWFVAAAVLMFFVLILWYCVKHSLQRRRQTPYQRGLYEHLFDELEDEYPLLWSSKGAVDEIEPTGMVNRMKWRLLKSWFAPERTINKKLYSSLTPEGSDVELGAWARTKRYFLMQWLPQILAERHGGDAVALAEIGSSRASLFTLQPEPAAINELMQMSTPLAMANAEPTAIRQISTYGLRPLGLTERRASGGTPKQSIEERPSSRGSSGIMIEERNLSDSESEAGEGASDHMVEGPDTGVAMSV